MMVSVLISPSAMPELRRASSSSLNGLPCASVRESEPTSRMSTAPSSAASSLLPLPLDLLWELTSSSEAESCPPKRPTAK